MPNGDADTYVRWSHDPTLLWVPVIENRFVPEYHLITRDDAFRVGGKVHGIALCGASVRHPTSDGEGGWIGLSDADLCGPMLYSCCLRCKRSRGFRLASARHARHVGKHVLALHAVLDERSEEN